MKHSRTTKSRIAWGIAPLALLAGCGDGSGSDAASPAETGSALATPASQATPAIAAAAPIAAAEPPAAFAICRSCHAIEAGRNGVGPTLFGIVGSKAGDLPGYTFSPALKASGVVWDRAKLDTWLAGPMKMVPGTKMVIAVPDAAKRQAIIDYLATLK